MKILIAEDDDNSRALLTEYVTDLGHEVRAAENGMRLVELAIQEKPDLILTDLHMPQMRGDSMIAMIDMYPGLSGIPVIVISGATPAEISDMGLNRSIPVLSKPFDLDKIKAAIEKVRSRSS